MKQIRVKVECLIYLSFVTTIVSISNVSHGADFCVSTSAELQTALTSASGNSESDTIKLQKGTYHTPGSQFFFSTSDSYELAITGGYNSDCTETEINPSNTILDGNNSNRVMRLQNNGSASGNSFTVTGITFQNGKVTGEFDRGGGLSVNALTSGGNITLISNIIKFNVSPNYFGGGLDMGSTDGICVLVNNLFHDNSASYYGAGTIACNGDSIGLFNNTIAENTASVGAGGLRAFGAGVLESTNNIFWGNTGVDFSNDSSNNVMKHNNVQEQSNVAGPNSIGNISSDPKFISLTDFRLQSNSPSVDSGFLDGGLGLLFAFIGSTDIDSKDRVSNSVIDMGAYERPSEEFCFITPTNNNKTVVFCL